MLAFSRDLHTNLGVAIGRRQASRNGEKRERGKRTLVVEDKKDEDVDDGERGRKRNRET